MTFLNPPLVYPRRTSSMFTADRQRNFGDPDWHRHATLVAKYGPKYGPESRQLCSDSSRRRRLFSN